MGAANDVESQNERPRREEILRLFHDAQNAEPLQNYVASNRLAEIARELEIPLAEAEGVISFYRHFSRRSRGRYVIRVCDSLSCRILGSLDVYRYLRHRLGIKRGQTTADGMYTLEVVNCLGSCDTAPNFMVNDTLYTNLDATKTEEILGALEREAQKEAQK
ncbi:MAG: NAD(P)H-dependent oxidoreductase subunit E [Spirochaetota bacterium]